MPTVAATEFQRNFGRFRELAQREPVAVRSHDRVSGYFVSAHDFEEYQKLKAYAATAIAIEALDDETLAAIADTKMDERHNHLNDLMD